MAMASTSWVTIDSMAAISPSSSVPLSPWAKSSSTSGWSSFHVLGGVDHGVVEVDRELGDEADLDGLPDAAAFRPPRRWWPRRRPWSPRSSVVVVAARGDAHHQGEASDDRCDAHPSSAWSLLLVMAAQGRDGARGRPSRWPTTCRLLFGRERQPEVPTMRATILSWLSGLGISSPTLRPRRMTTARSATSVTWSMAWEMTMTAWPFLAQAEDEVEDAARLAHAEGGGRLVEDDDLARRRRRRGPRRSPGAARRTSARRRPSASGSVTWRRSSTLDGGLGHRPAAEHPQRYGQPAGTGILPSGVEVGRRVEVVEQREVLVHGLDAVGPGGGRRGDVDRSGRRSRSRRRRGGARR